MPETETRPPESGPPLEMDFSSHLKELRRRLITALLCLGLGMIVAWNISPEIYQILTSPVLRVLPPEQKLISLKLPEGFLIRVRLSFFGGFILTAPMIFYQIWAFVAPGLHPGERRLVWPLTLLALALFLAGLALAYFMVLPLTFNFLAGFFGPDLELLPSAQENLKLVSSLLIAFGLAFELPLGLLFLNRLGLVDSAWLKKWRGYAILIIFIVAAVVTPPDVISQIMLALPLMLLYELSLLLIRLIGQPQPPGAGD